MASATMRTKFAFRRRASRFVLDELYSDEESDDEFAAYEGGIPPPSAFAAAHAGVDHVRISFLEARAFGDRAKGAAGEGAYLGMRNALLERPRLNGERPAAEGPRVAAAAGGGECLASASGGGAYEQVSRAEASARVTAGPRRVSRSIRARAPQD